MEESIPSSIKAGSQRGIPPREVIEYITQGELQQLTSFKLAKSDDKVRGSNPSLPLSLPSLSIISSSNVTQYVYAVGYDYSIGVLPYRLSL